jgi:hypothetical protein
MNTNEPTALERLESMAGSGGIITLLACCGVACGALIILGACKRAGIYVIKKTTPYIPVGGPI